MMRGANGALPQRELSLAVFHPRECVSYSRFERKTGCVLASDCTTEDQRFASSWRFGVDWD
jgi:hypothetical protein